MTAPPGTVVIHHRAVRGATSSTQITGRNRGRRVLEVKVLIFGVGVVNTTSSVQTWVSPECGHRRSGRGTPSEPVRDDPNPCRGDESREEPRLTGGGALPGTDSSTTRISEHTRGTLRPTTPQEPILPWYREKSLLLTVDSFTREHWRIRIGVCKSFAQVTSTSSFDQRGVGPCDLPFRQARPPSGVGRGRGERRLDGGALASTEGLPPGTVGYPSGGSGETLVETK